MRNCASGLFILAGFFSAYGLAWAQTQEADEALSSSTKTVQITVEARLLDTEPPINKGLSWRVFQVSNDETETLPLLANATGGTKTFAMSPGEYLVHVAYGYAGAVKKLSIGESAERHVFILNAGGLSLEAKTEPDGPISPSLLRFDVFSSQRDDRGVRPLVARDVRPGTIVPIEQGTYHIVSRYGALNAETRADLRVKAGELTQATMQHRAARITFRLVGESGGDAIADTSWSILSDIGDEIKSAKSSYPSMVLAEGNYTAIAYNADRIYSRDFEVQSGLNREVEVLVEN